MVSLTRSRELSVSSTARAPSTAMLWYVLPSSVRVLIGFESSMTMTTSFGYGNLARITHGLAQINIVCVCACGTCEWTTGSTRPHYRLTNITVVECTNIN